MEWIKCSEQLPDQDQEVLTIVYSEYKRPSVYDMAHCADPMNSGRMWLNRDNEEIFPTHWMNLPKID